MLSQIFKLFEAFRQSFVQINQGREGHCEEDELYEVLKGRKHLKLVLNVIVNFKSIASLRVPHQLEGDNNDKSYDECDDAAKCHVPQLFLPLLVDHLPLWLNVTSLDVKHDMRQVNALG